MTQELINQSFMMHDDILLIIDMKGIVLEVNNSAHHMGYVTGVSINDTLHEILDKTHSHNVFSYDHVSLVHPIYQRASYQGHDGTDHIDTKAQDCHIRISCLQGDDANQNYWCMMIRSQNISAAISDVDDNAHHMLSHVSATLAHEIKNPLSVIRGAAQLMNGHEYAQMIIDETDRITRLLNQLEPIGNIPKDCFSDLNIHEILDNQISLFSNSCSNLIIQKIYDPSLPFIMGSDDHLIQIFQNLFKNAIEAMGDITNPMISVSTGYLHGSSVIKNGKRMRYAYVKIADNGAGIPADIEQKMFVPFVTDKATGTGIGLALVKHLVEQHGGWVEWQGKKHDVFFKIMLPIA